MIDHLFGHMLNVAKTDDTLACLNLQLLESEKLTLSMLCFAMHYIFFL